MGDKLFIVMPAYNEEDNIEAVIKQWYPILTDKEEGSRLVIADSGSSDKTHDIILELKRDHPKIEILSDTGRFHGPKLMALYKYAIENDADYIFQTDSDGQTDPTEFEAFWNERSEYTGIFGNRPVRGDGKKRAFVEKVVCWLTKLYFGVDIPDANAPFRLMKTEAVSKYIDRMTPDYELPNIMITVFFAYYRENMKFETISFQPRKAGAGSVNVKRIMKTGMRSLGDFAAFRKSMKRDE